MDLNPESNSTVTVIKADFNQSRHATALIELMNIYAQHPMGGGSGLSEYARVHLAKEMARRPTLFSYIAFIGENPVGLVNCIESFSSFACKPLINIHDLVVKADYRHQGVAQALLAAVQQNAIRRGCCKLTLEVLENNHPARNLYTKFGFGPYSLFAGDETVKRNDQGRQTLFWQKSIN